MDALSDSTKARGETVEHLVVVEGVEEEPRVGVVEAVVAPQVLLVGSTTAHQLVY